MTFDSEVQAILDRCADIQESADAMPFVQFLAMQKWLCFGETMLLTIHNPTPDERRRSFDRFCEEPFKSQLKDFVDRNGLDEFEYLFSLTTSQS